MNRKILEMLRRPYALLIWALICGAGYLGIVARFVLDFTNTAAGGGILIWFFFPAIVCGAALLIIKAVKCADREENPALMLALFYVHMLIIIMGAVFAAAMLL